MIINFCTASGNTYSRTSTGNVYTGQSLATRGFDGSFGSAIAFYRSTNATTNSIKDVLLTATVSLASVCNATSVVYAVGARSIRQTTGGGGFYYYNIDASNTGSWVSIASGSGAFDAVPIGTFSVTATTAVSLVALTAIRGTVASTGSAGAPFALTVDVQFVEVQAYGEWYPIPVTMTPMVREKYMSPLTYDEVVGRLRRPKPSGNL